MYKRRRPERTDYYRIIEGRFEERERIRPACFEQKYGYLRKYVVRAIYAFLACGIPEDGVARYMSRAAISVERVRYNRANDSVTVTQKPFGSSPERVQELSGWRFSGPSGLSYPRHV